EGCSAVLNQAVRFFPIVRTLRSLLSREDTLLEVGSGASGIGEYWKSPFVGCDIEFAARPVKNMLAVRCEGQSLPFRDRSFDALVLSDVLEHVPPSARALVVSEAVRVARKIVIIGFPCGSAAFEFDCRLLAEYRTRNLTAPAWLEEHMLHAFPDDDLF